MLNIPRGFVINNIEGINDLDSSCKFYISDTTDELGCLYGTFSRALVPSYEPSILLHRRDLSDPDLGDFANCLGCSIAVAHSVHGNDVCFVNRLNYQSFNPNNDNFIKRYDDAMITNCKNVALCIYTADCVPVLIRHFSPDYVAVVHSGWKGSVLGINESVIETMLQMGCKLDSMKVFVGPSIFAKDYEVKDDLKNRFIKQSSSNEKYFCTIGQKMRFDNRRYVLDRYSGVSKIVDCAVNTFDSDLFASHRKGYLLGHERVHGMVSFIML